MKRLSNRQLSRWCGLSLGEVCVDGKVSACYSYDLGKTDDPVPLGIKIRLWGSNVWSDPVDNDEHITEGQST